MKDLGSKGRGALLSFFSRASQVFLLIMGFFEKFVFLSDMIGFFLVTRYPYFDLFCMLMKLGRSTENNRRINKVYTPSTSIFSMEMLRENFEVYLHGSIYFVCATGMTLDIGRRNCGLFSAFHIVYLAFSTCFENKQWSEFMMVKVVARAVAVVGCYLFVAGGLTDSRRGFAKVSNFLQIGRQLLALYLFYLAYMIWINREDRLALVKHIPGGIIMVIVVVVIYVGCGLCIYGGYEAGYFGKLATWQLLIVTLLSDLDTKFWYKANDRVDQWTQIQLASRHFAVMGGLILLGRKRHW